MSVHLRRFSFRRLLGPSLLTSLMVVLLFLSAAPGAQAQQRLVNEGASAPGDSIAFEEAVRLVLERNYRVRLAANDVESSSVDVANNRAEFYPDLQFSSSGGHDFGRNFVQSEGGIVSEASQSANLNVGSSINVFNGFQKDATLDQAQAQVKSRSRTLRRRRQDVVFDVVSRFIELAQNRDLVRVREENLELRQNQLEQTQAQIEVGQKPPSDIYQIRADVAAAEQQLLQAQRNVEATETNLARLLVLDPFAEHRFEVGAIKGVAEAEMDRGGYDLERLIERAYASRADLEAQLAAISASEQGVRAARSGYWPSLSLSAGYGSSWSSRSTRPIPGTGTPSREVELQPIGGGDPVVLQIPGDPDTRQTPFFDQLNDRRGGSIGFNLSFPLFDRFQTHYSVEQAQVQLENARFQREQLRHDIAVEVRQAYLDYQNAQKALDVTEQRLQAAEQAQEAAQERYRLGAANYVELAQSNADLASARSERVRARYDFLLQQKRIEYTIGVLNPEAPLMR